MALLTADDIRYRKFAPTRFREGYDVDEVDDFLDEVLQTVEELTRLAQGQATNTGTFSAVKPITADINSSQVVLGLRNENASLQVKISDLEQKLQEASVGAVPMVADDSGEKEQLLNDNRDLVQHLRTAEDEISTLKSRLDDAEQRASKAATEAPAQDGNVSQLIADLQQLQKDYDEQKRKNLIIEGELENLRNSAGKEAGDAGALQIEIDQLKSQLDEANAHVARLQVKLQNSEANTDTGSLDAINSAAGASSNQAAAMLSMAQQLHDEYVQKGKNESAKILEEAETDRDKLKKNAKEEHDKLIAEAKKENERIISEAQAKADETYETLAKERQSIEHKIDELRIFEKDYRNRLTKFLKNLLDDVDKHGVLAKE
jgi:DivIVA domain-containing protein